MVRGRGHPRRLRRATCEESGLDSLTQYELWKAIRNSIEERNWFELAWSLQRHDEFASAFLPLTFIGNHDVTRVASAITDPRHLAHAVAVLFFVAGTPAVYAGDERGLTGVKEERAGGDDAVRPEFPTAPTDWPARRGVPPLPGGHLVPAQAPVARHGRASPRRS